MNGEVECDASIMDGSSSSFGAVAAVSGKHCYFIFVFMSLFCYCYTTHYQFFHRYKKPNSCFKETSSVAEHFTILWTGTSNVCCLLKISSRGSCSKACLSSTYLNATPDHFLICTGFYVAKVLMIGQ